MNTFAVVLAVIGMALQGIFIAVEHKEKYISAVILKGSAAGIFCIIGVLAVGVSSNTMHCNAWMG